MIHKETISNQKKWLFNDNSQPFQIRVMTAPEINPVLHLHKTMHEYFYIVKGTMNLQVEDHEILMKQDDLVVVEPGERHIVTSSSEDLVLMLLMPPPVANDKFIF